MSEKINGKVLALAIDNGFEFVEPCNCGNQDGCICELTRSLVDEYYYLPTQTEVQRALREETCIHSVPELVVLAGNVLKWLGTTSFISENLVFKDRAAEFRDTYEEAMNDALELGMNMIERVEEGEEYDDEDYDDDDD